MKFLGWILTASLLIPILNTASAEFQAGLTLRTFVCDVTPPMGSPLCAGRIKPVVAVDEPLLAKGIILEDRGGRYVLCALDWCLLRGAAYDMFRDRIAEAVGTKPARVAVQCVHQHNAPNSDPRAQELLAATPDAPVHADNEFLKASAEKVAAAAKAARSQGESHSITHVGVSKAKVEKIASNRRVPMPDGSIGVRYSSCRDPQLQAAPEGLIDPWLRTVTFFQGDKPLVQMHYYATHPQSHYGDGRVTWDFPGIARERLQEETGVFQMYFTGCAGNITAGKYNDGKPQRRQEMADRLYAAMRESISGIERQPVQPIEWRVRPVRLPWRTDEGYDLKSLKAKMADPDKDRIQAALDVASLERMATNRPIDFTCLSMGPVHIVHLPGEPFIQYQLLAQSRRANEFVAVAGYGDDFTGYICNEKAYSEGGYEPTSTVLSPLGEYYMTAAIRDLLADQPPPQPVISRVARIWDAAPHCAFTDLIRHKGEWLCAFREGQKHVDEEANIRVIVSKDGVNWESAALLSDAGADLRDAKLSIMPDGKLMLLGGRRTWPPRYEWTLQSWVAFSDDGREWTQPRRILGDAEWLWRVTWYEGVGYGISYGSTSKQKDFTWSSRLLRTTDGVNYEQIATFGDYPGMTEATLRFASDGTARCIHRRDGGTRTALLGTSKPPYTDWTWRDTGFHMGGPALVQFKGQWYAAGRWVVGGAKTVLARVDFELGTLEPVLEFPSGGDNSYPAFVIDGDTLWMSYYSSHEGSTAIYLASIKFAAR